jgi:hypothetical protein
MREFAATGRMISHFFAMRDFTVDERVEVLQNYLACARDNGYFNVYFWQDDAYALNRGLSCFDRRTLMVFNPHTDYSLAENPMTVLAEPTVAGLIADYFREELLAKRVLPYSEGMAFLRELIEEAKRHR